MLRGQNAIKPLIKNQINPIKICNCCIPSDQFFTYNHTYICLIKFDFKQIHLCFKGALWNFLKAYKQTKTQIQEIVVLKMSFRYTLKPYVYIFVFVNISRIGLYFEFYFWVTKIAPLKLILAYFEEDVRRYRSYLR